jgi:hypothetical protein
MSGRRRRIVRVAGRYIARAAKALVLSELIVIFYAGYRKS